MPSLAKKEMVRPVFCVQKQECGSCVCLVVGSGGTDGGRGNGTLVIFVSKTGYRIREELSPWLPHMGKQVGQESRNHMISLGYL